MIKREAVTNNIVDDLNSRNENWDKLETMSNQLETEYEPRLTNAEANIVDLQQEEAEHSTRLDTAETNINGLLPKVDLATVDTQIGTFVQSKIADDYFVELTIEGATTITPTNPDLDISPDNVATITSAKDFDVVAENEDATKSNKLTITKELNKLPNGVADTRERIDDKYVKYTQRIGKEVFDGSADECWNIGSAYSDTLTRFYCTNALLKEANSNRIAISTNLIYNDDFWKNKKVGFQINENSFTRIDCALNTSRIPNVEKLREYLSIYPMVIQYELATPVETIVEEPSTLTSYKGITNVFTTSTAQPKLTVDFKSRLKNTTEILLAEIAKLKQAIISLGGTV